MDEKPIIKIPSDSSAELLNRLTREYIASKSPWYKRRFTSPIAAQFFSIILLIFFTVIYLIASYANQTEPRGDKFQKTASIFQQGIVIDKQTLNVELLEYELNKVITPKEVDNTRKVLTKKFSAAKESLLQGRLAVAKVSDEVLTHRLGKKYLPEVAGAMSLIVDNHSLESAQQLYPAEMFYPLLNETIVNRDLPPLTDKALLNEQSGTEIFQEMYTLAKLQHEREQLYLAQVANYVNSMQAYMSFEWLNRLPWIVQLIFWTWFGVLINNIVWLIRLTKSRKEEDDLAFTSEVYVMLLPRLVIAPFISVIFLAMISSGIASFDISNLNNLPAFLVAAFFLGFMSESITLRIRQFFNKLLDSIETQQQPKLSLATIEPTPSFKPIANTSLSSLEINMRGLVNNDVNVTNIRNQIIKKAHLDKTK
ncbi:hypothetical protein H4J58_16065 [Colwellia sp. MB3u-70]|uniref:hypothetical protein n=1 Tax=unclassified Colwellia TaxID=196834 RepID=UPI0015F4D6AD|nr:MULTISPECIES: hypothetical protein [unclassified Colwellia]MBA6291984.1 hypothetical protein [Colwellia sp. MB3u-8]MBA6308628.1 hypothetical protein [Colwellia sp. MB3u-70]